MAADGHPDRILMALCRPACPLGYALLTATALKPLWDGLRGYNCL